MKITKLRLKEIIKEEINKADPKLLAAIDQLTSTIEDLDISMDFLGFCGHG